MLKCSRCLRINPPDAVFCYFDGMVLTGQAHHGPVNMALLPFPTPFVFPSGRVCQNFDQLALACYEDDTQAMELLQQGDLASFLSGMGRADLAKIAREAAKALDLHRGLDDLLTKIPCSSLTPPKLEVQPTEINLGELRGDEKRQLSLTLINRGMRLVYGSIRCKDIWIALGEASGAQQKLFEFKSNLGVPILIHGHRLAARPKPYEAKLVVESNGGDAEVIVRVSVAVKPFPDGVLAGAISPRQVAEKAKAHAKEAASFFENGSVARWYQQNGWSYPVQGPATSGLAAIQQYFEAHGLARAPRVELNQHQVSLQGTPGEQLRCQLEVRTNEKRSVYALASSNHSWLTIEPTPPRGQLAQVSLLATVPDRPGETLQARVTIRANGNQQFVVPVSLVVNGRKRKSAVHPNNLVQEVHGGAAAVLFPTPRPSAASHSRTPRPIFRPKKSAGIGLVHLLPALLLILGLGGMVAHDWFTENVKDRDVSTEVTVDEPRVIPTTFVQLQMQDDKHRYPAKVDPKNTLGGTMRFGLVMGDSKDPSVHKRLTYSQPREVTCGQTNNTCLKVDDQEVIFGQPPGRWLQQFEPLGNDDHGRPRQGARSVWSNDGRIIVTQMVEIIHGQTGALDTCLVRYQIENKDTFPHPVGIRFMLDTFIGDNDGVPFTIAGQNQLFNTTYDSQTVGAIPDFVQALENDDLAKPGTIALVQLRVGSDIEPPARVTLGAWPSPDLNEKFDPKNRVFNQFMTKWDVPVISMQSMKDLFNKPADSAVVMYWPVQQLPPNGKRLVGFSYGLGNVSSNASGKLGLTAGGSMVEGGEFSVTAYVTNPQPGQTVALKLPKDLILKDGNGQQPVPPVPAGAAEQKSTVTWKVQAAKPGDYLITAETSTGAKASLKLFIRKQKKLGILD